MQTIGDLETPAVLIELNRVERNISRMAKSALRAGVALRPHGKTHKLPEIARLQVQAGARGITLAKVTEAEVFAAHGFDDIFLAYPIVGEDKARRLLDFPPKVKLTVGVDSVEGAMSLAGAFVAAGRTLDVLIKLDVGFARVGVPPARLATVAQRIAEVRGLNVRGVFTHAGHAYSSENTDVLAVIGRSEADLACAAARDMRSLGVTCDTVSVGSTPTALYSMSTGITETRPGTYVYYDASQASLGICSVEDCALTVLATVVSAPDEDRAVVDAGSKSLSTDPLRPQGDGHGWICGHASRIARVSEEHGVIKVVPGERFRVGDRVQIIPNHACVVSNLHDVVYAVRGEKVEACWLVAARGRVR